MTFKHIFSIFCHHSRSHVFKNFFEIHAWNHLHFSIDQSSKIDNLTLRHPWASSVKGMNYTITIPTWASSITGHTFNLSRHRVPLLDGYVGWYRNYSCPTDLGSNLWSHTHKSVYLIKLLIHDYKSLKNLIINIL